MVILNPSQLYLFSNYLSFSLYWDGFPPIRIVIRTYGSVRYSATPGTGLIHLAHILCIYIHMIHIIRHAGPFWLPSQEHKGMSIVGLLSYYLPLIIHICKNVHGQKLSHHISITDIDLLNPLYCATSTNQVCSKYSSAYYAVSSTRKQKII